MANSSMLGICFPKIEIKLHKLDDVKILQFLKNGIYGDSRSKKYANNWNMEANRRWYSSVIREYR